MYDEISFLFDTNGLTDSSSSGKILNNNDSTNIFDNTIEVRFKGNKEFPDNKNKNNIKNFLNSSSYIDDESDINPYITILKKLEEYKQLKLSYADLAYLTNLGVYPVNRLVILRRFAEGVIVPHNLNELEASPISTIIGWVKPEQDNLFNITFSERWKETNQFFWDAISDIVKRDTGIELNKSIPIPSWGQGFLFQFLKAAGVTEFSESEIPIGDPDVLKTSITRDVENQGIESSFQFDFNTSYEQKYINNIDSGSAFLDIIDKILRMGTSDMKYMLGGSKVNDWMKSLNSDSKDYASGIGKQIMEMAKTFNDTLQTIMKNVKDSDNLIKETKEVALNGLNAALYRFRWDLRGSLSVTTGIHTTPWHITIGNPLNPILSMGNIIVSGGKIDFGNEMSFNDMPTKINLSFTVAMGRPLGKSDIVKVLNNAYSRTYSKQS